MSLAVLLLIVVWAVMRSRNWKTVAVGNGDHAEDIEAKYAYLKTNQIKCQLKTEAAAGMGVTDPGARGRTTVKLNVHANDLERAGLLLDEFDKQQLPL